MGKPEAASGYDKEVTENCERLLVTLLRNLGPWKKSIYLVGGLTPRYLIPKVPARQAPTCRNGRRRCRGQVGDVGRYGSLSHA